VNGLTPALLTHNPNSANPVRLAPSQAATCDMDHEYKAEQEAFNGGLMDKFVEKTSSYEKDCSTDGVMAYFDGNTVTALWNYAQRFAMSDNSFNTGFGPSTPGALNLISGNTHGVVPATLAAGAYVMVAEGTMIGDPDPTFDDCSRGKTAAMQGTTIGDLLNAKKLTWGWFQGGFRPTEIKDGKAVCGDKSVNLTGATVSDYSPHHQPFQYYQASANPHHLPPTGPIGATDQANHQYDLRDFYATLAAGQLPAVSFIKAKMFQDGHAGKKYSNPLDEQSHLVRIVNAIQQSPVWKNTLVIIAYDDSDGWYDHVMPPILNGSSIAELDALNGPGRCGTPKAGAHQGRCGYGPRLPLLVISPYARKNYVDHSLTDQTSIIRFIEDNWNLGRIGDQSMDALAGSLFGMFDFTQPDTRPLLLDEKTGQPVKPRHAACRPGRKHCPAG
jgi:phospholipase C